jgi:hypothetical protein
MIAETHYQPTTQGCETPILEPYAWDRAFQDLDQILLCHEAPANEGDVFLVGQLKRQIQVGEEDTELLYYDYMLQRTGRTWKPIMSVYKDQSPFEYDFDVFEMRPIEQSMGLH